MFAGAERTFEGAGVVMNTKKCVACGKQIIVRCKTETRCHICQNRFTKKNNAIRMKNDYRRRHGLIKRKTCRFCNQEIPDSKRIDSLHCSDKCASADWYKREKDNIREHRREYNAQWRKITNHRSSKKYYEKNKIAIFKRQNARVKINRALNPEKFRAKRRQYYKSNKKYFLEMNKLWTKNNIAKSYEINCLKFAFGTAKVDISTKTAFSYYQLLKRVLDGKIKRTAIREKINLIESGETHEAYH